MGWSRSALDTQTREQAVEDMARGPDFSPNGEPGSEPLRMKRIEKFCQEYVIDFQGAEAARRAGYTAKYADKQAYRLKRRADVSARIAWLDSAKVKSRRKLDERVLEALEQLAFDDPDTKPGDRLKALELLGKSRGMWIDRSHQVIEEMPEISAEDQALWEEAVRLQAVEMAQDISRQEIDREAEKGNLRLIEGKATLVNDDATEDT